MKALRAAAALACTAWLLTGCSNILYLPSDAANEDVQVETDVDLLEEITVSADYCDDITIQGTLTNNSTSDASVDVTIGLDDGLAPQEMTTTVAVAAGTDAPFTLDNTTGINPFMGCYATIDAARIVPEGS